MKTKGKLDYTKICWYCGKPAVLPAGDYFRCSECGTTWNKVIKIGPPIVTLEPATSDDVSHYHSRPRRLPCGSPPPDREG